MATLEYYQTQLSGTNDPVVGIVLFFIIFTTLCLVNAEGWKRMYFELRDNHKDTYRKVIRNEVLRE